MSVTYVGDTTFAKWWGQQPSLEDAFENDIHIQLNQVLASTIGNTFKGFSLFLGTLAVEKITTILLWRHVVKPRSAYTKRADGDTHIEKNWGPSKELRSSSRHVSKRFQHPGFKCSRTQTSGSTSMSSPQHDFPNMRSTGSMNLIINCSCVELSSGITYCGAK